LIGDPNDPSTDSFVRVGSPYDIQNIPTDRTTAVNAGNDNYLSAEFTRDFDDLETAKQAKSLIYSRIDTLVNTWFDYISNFYGEDVLSTHPTADASYEQQLKDTYSEAKDARKEAETDLSEADSALAAAQTEVDNAIVLVDVYKKEKDFCALANQEYWSAFKSASDLFKPASETFFTAMIAAYNSWADTDGDGTVVWPAEPTLGKPYYTQRLAMHSAMTEYYDNDFAAYKVGYSSASSLDTAMNTFCQNAAVNYGVVVNNKNAKDKAVEDAVTAKKEAEAALAAAQKAESAALAAVVDVCPDFDPESV
jgi:hypothetical protein